MRLFGRYLEAVDKLTTGRKYNTYYFKKAGSIPAASTNFFFPTSPP